METERQSNSYVLKLQTLARQQSLTVMYTVVEEDDEGRYLCEAENGVNDPLAAVVNLKVNGKKQRERESPFLSAKSSRNGRTSPRFVKLRKCSFVRYLAILLGEICVALGGHSRNCFK